MDTPTFELRFETDAKMQLAPNFKLRDERRRLSLGLPKRKQMRPKNGFGLGLDRKWVSADVQNVFGLGLDRKWQNVFSQIFGLGLKRFFHTDFDSSLERSKQARLEVRNPSI